MYESENKYIYTYNILLFSCSVVSLRPHGLQPARLPCPSVSPSACSNSCVLSWWCHPIISSSVALFSSCFQSFPASGSFHQAVCIRWPKYWGFSFSISPSKDYSGLMAFRIDWFDLLAVQGTRKSLLQHHNLKASILLGSFLHGPTFTSIHDYHSFDYTDFCWQSDFFAY